VDVYRILRDVFVLRHCCRGGQLAQLQSAENDQERLPMTLVVGFLFLLAAVIGCIVGLFQLWDWIFCDD
jgi:hypothetical protein